MKKKTARKLTLNRETINHLDTVVGGASYQTNGPKCNTDACGSPGEGSGGITGPTWCQTCGACSSGCETGGACTT